MTAFEIGIPDFHTTQYIKEAYPIIWLTPNRVMGFAAIPCSYIYRDLSRMKIRKKDSVREVCDLTFSYKTGEQALSAAKHSARDNRSYFFARLRLPDGTDCFEVKDQEGKVIELHQVK